MGSVGVSSLGGIAVLTLEADRRNAITLDTARAIEDAIAKISEDAAAVAVVVTGAGPTFCSGADRHLLANADEETLRVVYRSFLAVRECPLPTVAAVNGPAIGAGLNLALACDVRIAARSALFDSRFLQLPIHPGGGHLWSLDRLVGPQAASALAVFDQALTAERACEVGLVWDVVPDGEVVAASLAFCSRLAGSPAAALARTIKSTLRAASATVSYSEAVEYELHEQLESMATPQFRSRMEGAR